MWIIVPKNTPMSYFGIVKKWNNGGHANTKIVYLLRHSDERSLVMESKGVKKKIPAICFIEFWSHEFIVIRSFLDIKDIVNWIIGHATSSNLVYGIWFKMIPYWCFKWCTTIQLVGTPMDLVSKNKSPWKNPKISYY